MGMSLNRLYELLLEIFNEHRFLAVAELTYVEETDAKITLFFDKEEIIEVSIWKGEHHCAYIDGTPLSSWVKRLTKDFERDTAIEFGLALYDVMKNQLLYPTNSSVISGGDGVVLHKDNLVVSIKKT